MVKFSCPYSFRESVLLLFYVTPNHFCLNEMCLTPNYLVVCDLMLCRQMTDFILGPINLYNILEGHGK